MNNTGYTIKGDIQTINAPIGDHNLRHLMSMTLHSDGKEYDLGTRELVKAFHANDGGWRLTGISAHTSHLDCVPDYIPPLPNLNKLKWATAIIVEGESVVPWFKQRKGFTGNRSLRISPRCVCGEPITILISTENALGYSMVVGTTCQSRFSAGEEVQLANDLVSYSRLELNNPTALMVEYAIKSGYTKAKTTKVRSRVKPNGDMLAYLKSVNAMPIMPVVVRLHNNLYIVREGINCEWLWHLPTETIQFVQKGERVRRYRKIKPDERFTIYDPTQTADIEELSLADYAYLIKIINGER